MTAPGRVEAESAATFTATEPGRPMLPKKALLAFKGASQVNKLTCCIAVVLAASLVSLSDAGAIRYVDDDALPSGDGLSWGTAYRFLQDALAEASVPINGVLLIRVAQGTYLPDRTEAIPSGTGDRSSTFSLPAGVLLAGGYAGIGAVDPDARDSATFVAILSGDIDGNDPDILGNSYHVVSANGAFSALILDGFTITGGHANGGGSQERHGAGLWHNTGDLVVSACVFIQNQAIADGGAMRLQPLSTAPVCITDCVLSGNSAKDGGGIWVAGGAEAETILTNCLFVNNSASGGGGAVWGLGSDLTFINCDFDGNVAVSNSGGGALRTLSTVSATFLGCNLMNNSAEFGGAIYHTSSGQLILDECSLTGNSAIQGGSLNINPGTNTNDIRNCNFSGNVASNQGGAVFIFRRATVLMNCSFDGNSAGASGGAIGILEADPVILQCTFVGNSAGGGGAIRIDVGSALIANCLFFNNDAVLGGAINNFAADPNIVNCTIGHNIATDSGGGMFNFSGMPIVTNTILWANSDLDGMDESAQIDGIIDDPVVNYSCVQGGWSGSGGTGNIVTDPMFVDPLTGDLHLLPGSPCIDAGNNSAIVNMGSTDLDGNPRFADDPNTPDTGCGVPVVVDMGAYEFQGNPATVKVGDIDGDGAVAVPDLLTLLAAWGPTGGGCQLADFDLDDIVGVPDLLILLANWG